MTEAVTIVHAADPSEDAGLIIALCGEVGFIREDSEITPKSFDFAPPWSPYVDCEECLAAKAAAKLRAASEKAPA